jgi:hypothetical protein
VGRPFPPPPPIEESIDRSSRQSTSKLLVAPVSTEKTIGRSRRQSVPKEPLRSQNFPFSGSLQEVDLIDSSPVNSASQTVYPYLARKRRRFKVKGSDSESRTSFRLSKRRKCLTQSSDAFNILSVDSTTSMEHLDNSKAQDLFEAALNKATHRAHEAEHKLHDVSQKYAESLKAEKEAHMKALEVKEREVRVAKEKLLLTRLFEMKELYDAFRAHMGSQVEQFKALLVDSFEEVNIQHSALASFLSDENFDDTAVKRLFEMVNFPRRS